nr:methyl-CpG-binding domain-containing protein 9 [Ipomoea batatas]
MGLISTAGLVDTSSASIVSTSGCDSSIGLVLRRIEGRFLPYFHQKVLVHGVVEHHISVRISFKADIVFVSGTGLQDSRVEEHLTNLAECKDNNCLISEAEKESDDFISRVNESSLPKAPCDEGICKVCGVDKDDDNVSMYQKDFSHKLLEALGELAKAMELKEYWKLTLQEALNSVIIRDHIDQCASLSADLQQKLRSLNSELKALKLREEFFTADLAKVKNNVGHGGDFGSNAFSYGVVSDVKLNGQVSESGAQSLSSSFSRQCT